jgi:hypothetical protein
MKYTVFAEESNPPLPTVTKESWRYLAVTCPPDGNTAVLNTKQLALSHASLYFVHSTKEVHVSLSQ